MTFNQDGTRLAASIGGSPDDPTSAGPSLVKVWEVPSGKEISTLKGHAGWVYGLDFNPEGARLAGAIGQPPNHVSSVPGEVKLWDLNTGQEVLTLNRHSAKVTCVKFSPKGRRLMSAAGDDYHGGEVLIWDASAPTWRTKAP
jgi:hypothetical protein